jgi:glucan biosynthesis protein
MNKINNTIKLLIKVANILDETGYYKVADKLTDTLKRIAWTTTQNPWWINEEALWRPGSASWASMTPNQMSMFWDESGRMPETPIQMPILTPNNIPENINRIMQFFPQYAPYLQSESEQVRQTAINNVNRILQQQQVSKGMQPSKSLQLPQMPSY